jgi:hypothetical protein
MLAFNIETALLCNNKKCNELEDDQESCLHVLTWTALRFSKHTGSGGGFSELFMRSTKMKMVSREETSKRVFC